MCDIQRQEDNIQEQLDAIRNAYRKIIANDKDKIVGWCVNGSDKVFPLDWSADDNFLVPIIGEKFKVNKDSQKQITEIGEADGGFMNIDNDDNNVNGFVASVTSNDSQPSDITYSDPQVDYERFIRDIADSSASASHQAGLEHNDADDSQYDIDGDDSGTDDSYPYMKTVEEFRDAFLSAREIFVDKLTDYGPSWRILRPMSVTDQLYNKAARIRNIDETGISAVGEGIYPEFQALVNYGIVALIQLELGPSLTIDMSADAALKYFDKKMNESFDLMCKKNEDYNEAWRNMRVCSYTDFILVKLARIKQIEENRGQTIVSEGIDSNYMDIINYAVFALIKLNEAESSKE